MRFFEDGPTIPDELLTARDEGRVVFFCGAGVSIARAGLPDFLGLAESVVAKLRVSADSSAYKLLNEAREIGLCAGADGLIPADRIFGLLEREFFPRYIESAVTEVLKPSPNVDPSAHKILLDLATTPKGEIRLVTTNFDRLFDDPCLFKDRRDELQTWVAPHLPYLSHHDEMNGIVYLHGRANKEYTTSGDGRFILSSAQFDRAYLAEGWATRFFKEVMACHVVVFVGYGADDPPVHYLLEGIDQEKRSNGMYAFQSGVPDEAAAKWRHKGVEAIAYPKGCHRTLWETLEAWAQKARSPDAWYESIIDLAKKGPTNLQPHERGQIAYIPEFWITKRPKERRENNLVAV